MSEYCAQCATEYRMTNGFSGECMKGQSICVVCEGCGHTIVNHLGQCIDPECPKDHQVEFIPLTKRWYQFWR